MSDEIDEGRRAEWESGREDENDKEMEDFGLLMTETAEPEEVDSNDEEDNDEEDFNDEVNGANAIDERWPAITAAVWFWFSLNFSLIALHLGNIPGSVKIVLKKK